MSEKILLLHPDDFDRLRTEGTPVFGEPRASAGRNRIGDVAKNRQPIFENGRNRPDAIGMPKTITGGKQPLPPELLERIRAKLGPKPSRQALSSLGVHHTTLTTALAGLPIGRGSRAAIREAMQETSGAV